MSISSLDGSDASMQNRSSPRSSRACVLRAEQVTKVFNPRAKTFASRHQRAPLPALGPVTLQVDPAEFLAVVGPSGCGKSTLLRLLAGLLPVSGGSVWRHADLQEPGGMSMVFQTPALLPWRTTFGNIVSAAPLLHMDRRSAHERAEHLLSLVGLESFADALPHELSGGMQQRAALCRALLGSPTLLFMDEPFASIDAITREQLTWDLQRLWLEAGNSVLFVTHNVEEALLLADRVLVMTTRPARIHAVISNDLNRPRSTDTLTDTAFAAKANEIRGLLAEVTSTQPAPQSNPSAPGLRR